MSCLSDREIAEIAATGQADDLAWEHVADCGTCARLLAEALAPQLVAAAHGRSYALGAELARGGMGRVVRAKDKHLGRPVAIKLSTVGNAVNDTRFQREIELTARLQHPNIIPIYDAGELDGAPFYAMRPVAGQRLDERIAAATTREQRLLLLPHVLAVVDAMAYAHRQGVIHRDLKPQNVLVGEHGETVVIDWGLGKQIGEPEDPRASVPNLDPTKTALGSIVGTPGYMAPEQARGEITDRRTDVYALGCILFQALTGEPPRKGSSEAAIVLAAEGEPIDVSRRAPDLPGDLRAIIVKATEPDPANRYADAGELGADLRRYQAGLLVDAYRYRWYQRVARGLRRHRMAVAVIASVLVSGVLIGGVAIEKVLDERDRANTERAAATNLLGFLVDDLPMKLRGVGHLDVLSDAASRLDSYYTQVTPARADLAAELVRHAEVKALRAGVATLAGQAGSADALSAAALDLAREAERRGEPGASDVLAQLLVDRGTSIEAADPTAARASFEAALAKLATLPETPARRTMHALAALRLSSIALAASKLDEAGRLIADAHAALPPDPGDVLWANLASSIDYVDAQRRWALRDLPGARAAIEPGIAAAKLAVRRGPWRSEGHQALAAAESLLGGVLIDQGDVAGAEQALADAAAIQRALVEVDPDNVALRVALASTLSDLANARDQLGKGDAAGSRREALQLLDALIASQPQNAGWRALQIRILREAGDVTKAEASAKLLPADLRTCTLVDIARDRAVSAIAAHDLGDARAALDHASQLLAAEPAPHPDCMQFQPFEVLIDRATATPSQRAALLDQARQMAAELRAQGIDDTIAHTLQQKIDDAAKAP
jgi:hypothetical protein